VRILLASLLLGVSLQAAAAQDPEIDCENAMAQQDMNICAAQDAGEADEELNTIWKEARKAAVEQDRQYADSGLEPGAEAALLKAQRGWIAFRDGTCDLAGFEARGGSLEPMLVSSCIAAMTRERTKQLKHFIEGGDL